jgi:predicted aldo/keto reductase-like oxidoreductase
MLYRTMPKTGDELSILGFGCMRLPSNDKGVIDEDRSVKQLRYAIDHGVNYLDTAWTYNGGQSEPFLGRALRDGYRKKVRLATKLPFWLMKSREDMDRCLYQQLEKLDTDCIDYYLLHGLDGNAWDYLNRLGVLDFVDKALTEGRIVNAGFSFHGMFDDFRRIVEAFPWEFCQIQYNYLDQENQAGTKGLELAAERGLGVVVMEPLRGGNLGIPNPPTEIDTIWQTAETKRSPVEWALRWIWNRPEVTVVLSGMNEEAHIEENLIIADAAYPNSLSKKECLIVDQAANKYNELMKVGCTGCGYCMPCPSMVKIPRILEIYNKMHLFGDEEKAKLSYALVSSGLLSESEPGYASNCTQCGECLEKCPQHLDIPYHLQKVAKEMEGPEFEERVVLAKRMYGIA